jgi:solute carrier family 13 (sodium-dependent dicarboxylate transporter), member 2/3/5
MTNTTTMNDPSLSHQALIPDTANPDNGSSPLRWFFLLLGPAVSFILLMLPAPAAMPESAWRVAAIGVWMAIWWMTEAIPIAVTALLPIILFPLVNVASLKMAAEPYANPIIYLFLGGFVVARAVERCGLHTRMALTILRLAGTCGHTIIGGFMVAAAGLSMWISNTSTTMMLLPIGLSIVTVITSTLPGLDKQQLRNFQMAMLLGIAYGATIGGIATLVGTPPNAFLAGFMLSTYNVEIGFARWLLVGVPLTVVMLPITWLVLVRGLFPVHFNAGTETAARIHRLYRELGPVSAAEKRVAGVFIALSLAWITRPLLQKIPGLENLSDTGIALIAALSLFGLNDGSRKKAPLITWDYAVQMPWGVLVLFGGGLSLAAAVSQTGLAEWLGQSLAPLGGFGAWALVLAAVVIVIFLTELTSNIATTATFLPVVAAIAIEAGINPLLLAAPVTLAASCAFMLPVATAPNAVVFSSGLLTVRQMARAGLALNLIGVVLVSAMALILVPIVF